MFKLKKKHLWSRDQVSSHINRIYQALIKMTFPVGTGTGFNISYMVAWAPWESWRLPSFQVWSRKCPAPQDLSHTTSSGFTLNCSGWLRIIEHHVGSPKTLMKISSMLENDALVKFSCLVYYSMRIIIPLHKPEK